MSANSDSLGKGFTEHEQILGLLRDIQKQLDHRLPSLNIPTIAPSNYVDCEIKKRADLLVFTRVNGVDWYIEFAPRFPDCMGYVIEGRLCNAPIVYRHKDTRELATDVDRYTYPNYEILHATAVRFEVKK